MNRRDFIKYTSALAAISAAPASFAFNHFAKQRWEHYQKSIIIDGLSVVFGSTKDTLTTKQLATIKNSGITAVNATIPYPGHNFEQTNQRINFAKNVIEKYPNVLSLITSASDILKAKQKQQVGIILGFQSTEMFGHDITRIKHFADQGVRIMQLTYNNQSQFGDGGLVKENKGLSTLGIEALAEMENQKVLVDLSHSGQKTVAEAISRSTRPLTISHTGCNALYQHPRNNDDKELKAVADKGGVVGIYLMPFLRGGEDEITAKDVIQHLDHAINVCGEDHVSIGSDQGVEPIKDGPAYREAIRKEVAMRIKKGISAPGETPNRPPFVAELNSERRMELIAYHMEKRGYKAATIEKVIGGNLFKLYKSTW